jgi:glycosyltransferase involved in cell wall biosynthesis
LKVVHIITGLNGGGAEGVLFRLCSFDQQSQITVISLTDLGKYGPLLEKLNISVQCLNMQRGRMPWISAVNLWRLLRKIKPDVVQTWMYHADLFGGVLSRLAGIRNVVWGIRHGSLDSKQTSRSTFFVAKLSALISQWVPRVIIVCAQGSLKVHAAMGYDLKRMVYVPNGYDLGTFFPQTEVGNFLKLELGIPETVPLVGMVGRFNPQKDHANLLEALALLKSKTSNFACVLVGTGVDQDNPMLAERIMKYGLSGHVFLLGQRNDVPNVMQALDLHVLSSSSEGFPNVIAEAMSSGTPCVTTDVGDAAVIVANTGWVVPAKQPDLLAKAIEAALNEMQSNSASWLQRCQECRNRILSEFSVEKMVDNFHKVWISK